MIFEQDKCYTFNENCERLFEGIRKRNIYLIKPAEINNGCCLLSLKDHVFA